MSTPDEESKKIPEWNIFDRLDELEDITLQLMEKTDKAEPVLKDIASMLNDALIMGKAGVFFSFVVSARVAGHDYRKGKDIFIETLRSQGLSKERVKDVEDTLVRFCKLIEKKES